MGTWGVGSFENDDAADWVWELAEADAALLSSVLSQVLQNTGYLEAPDCARAVAAAEVVAALSNRPATNLPEEVSEFVRRIGAAPNPELVSSARAAMARIRSSSELQELWKLSDHNAEWLQSIADLESRLA